MEPHCQDVGGAGQSQGGQFATIPVKGKDQVCIGCLGDVQQESQIIYRAHARDLPEQKYQGCNVGV